MTDDRRHNRLLEDALARGDIHAELILPGVPTPTVPDAAAALGVTEAQILKSLLFTSPDGAVALAVACGPSRINVTRLATLMGVTSAKLAPPSVVLQRTGYPAGGTPPVAHATPVPVFVDIAVMSLPVAYAGGGRIDALLRITPEEIVRATGATVIDIAD